MYFPACGGEILKKFKIKRGVQKNMIYDRDKYLKSFPENGEKPNIISVEYMLECERRAGDLAVLMQTAGTRLAEFINYKTKLKNILILVGKGNNGGDGIVCANLLVQHGFDVTMFFVYGIPTSSLALEVYKKMDGRVKKSSVQENIDFLRYDTIVDCVFGTGFHGELDEKCCSIFRSINALPDVLKIACDIPSGVDARSGAVSENSFAADFTLTFHAVKLGCVLKPACEKCGVVYTADIGIPQKDDHDEIIDVVGMDTVGLAPLSETVHKGNQGTLAIIAGCKDYVGAAALCCTSAIRSGAGIVNLISTDEVVNAVSSSIYEVVYTRLKTNEKSEIEKSEYNFNTLKNQVEKADAVLIGCGIGQSKNVYRQLKQTILFAEKSLVIDADGLNLLSRDLGVLDSVRTKNLILTPHLGELARLCHVDIKEVKNNPYIYAKKFAKEHECIVVAKSATTIICSPERTAVSNFGTPALAKAGSGDMLAGLIASFVCQGIKPFCSCVLGCEVLGLSADILCRSSFSSRGIIARDILNQIPNTLFEIENSYGV